MHGQTRMVSGFLITNTVSLRRHTNRLVYLLPNILSYLFTFLLTYNNRLRMGPFCLQAAGLKRQPNLALIFLLIFLYSIFC